MECIRQLLAAFKHAVFATFERHLDIFENRGLFNPSLLSITFSPHHFIPGGHPLSHSLVPTPQAHLNSFLTLKRGFPTTKAFKNYEDGASHQLNQESVAHVYPPPPTPVRKVLDSQQRRFPYSSFFERDWRGRNTSRARRSNGFAIFT